MEEECAYDPEKASGIGKKFLDTLLDEQTMNNMNMTEYIDNSGLVYQRWNHTRYQADVHMQNLENELDDLYINIEMKIQNSDDPRTQSLIRSASGLKRQVEASSHYKKLERKIKKHALLCEYIKRIVENLQFNDQRRIQNKLDMMKLEDYQGF